MTDQLLQFHKLFPKMVELDLCLFRKNDDRMKIVEKMLRRNGQLEYLSIGNFWNVDILKRISKMPVLESLKLCWNNRPNGFPTDGEIHFGNVINLQLKSQYRLNDWPKEMMFMKFNQLEEFTLTNVDLPKDFQFFQVHPMINKLTYSENKQQFQLGKEELERLKCALPTLTDLRLDGCKYTTIEQAILIIQTMTQLKAFCLRLCTVFNGQIKPMDLDQNEEVENFLARCRNEWAFSNVGDSGGTFIKLQLGN